MQNVYRMPDVLNAQEFAMIMSEARMMDGLPDYDYASLVPDWEAIKNGTWKGTNWLDESRNENAPIQNHALNITGGTEQSVYSIGLAYTDQEGILGAPSQPEYTRYTARINSEHTLYRKGKLDIIKVGENLTYSYSEETVLPLMILGVMTFVICCMLILFYRTRMKMVIIIMPFHGKYVKLIPLDRCIMQMGRI